MLLFDAAVRCCFSDCTGIDTADTDWLQVQLSLSRGGFGLCSLALHSPATYLASLMKATDEYSLESFNTFNSMVQLVHDISSLSHKVLSARLENQQFEQSCYFSLPLPTVHDCCLCPHTMLHPGWQSFLRWALTFTLSLMSSRFH